MKIKFCISSNKNFYKKTYNLIIRSLLNCGISKEDIYMFIGGEEKYQKIENDINLFFVDHNSFDFTSLISILDLNLSSDYWFSMHDTCFVGKNFLNILNNFNHDTQAVKLYSELRDSMNIGSYSQQYLNLIKDKILNFKNKDYSPEGLNKFKSSLVLNEGLFFKECTVKNYSSYKIKSGPTDFYENGVLRILEYYPELDFYKVKANWEIKNDYEVNL